MEFRTCALFVDFASAERLVQIRPRHLVRQESALPLAREPGSESPFLAATGSWPASA